MASVARMSASDDKAPPPIASVLAELADLEARGLHRRLPDTTGGNGTTITVGGKTALNFCSNNYLGLADHPILAAAATSAMVEAGVGAGAARLVTGNLALHRELEIDLAAWKGTPAALLFNSGYQANIGVVPALAGPEDAVYSDALNHASIVDGCRLSRATIHAYPHLDIDRLASLLAAGRHHRRRVVVTESLFSMDGDLAPLAAIADLCRRNGAFLIVDEAHAGGALGPEGRGLCHDVGVDLQIGTLGKALGVFGAYAAGSQPLMDLLVNRARSFVFSTALPVPVVAAARAALEMVRSVEGDRRRARLAANVGRLREGLAAIGLLRGDEAPMHVLPLVVGDPQRTMALSARLLEEGFFLQGIRPPTVPASSSRLRLTVTASHRFEEIDALIAALAVHRAELRP